MLLHSLSMQDMYVPACQKVCAILCMCPHPHTKPVDGRGCRSGGLAAVDGCRGEAEMPDDVDEAASGDGFESTAEM